MANEPSQLGPMRLKPLGQIPVLGAWDGHLVPVSSWLIQHCCYAIQLRFVGPDTAGLFRVTLRPYGSRKLSATL